MVKNCKNILLSGVIFAIMWGLTGSIMAADAVQEQKIFSFGVITDIQYADKKERGKRHYRKALDKLKECVKELNKQKLAFTIQLGDLIDGNTAPEKTLFDLEKVLEEYGKLSMQKYHVVGNHYLATGKKTLQQKLKLNKFYYNFTIPEATGWRFIVLNGNNVGSDILGKEQLGWLRLKLTEASRNKEKVIIFNHFALLKSAASHHLMNEPQPVLNLINESGCVVAYFAGHDHAGGYAFQDGIHHVTVKGMVEAPVHNAYAVIEVYPSKIKEVGYGKEPSRELVFPRSISPEMEHIH